MLLSNYYKIALFILIVSIMTPPAFSQNSSEEIKKTFSINKGTVLTGFSLDWTNANRDEYNHEFERGFSRVRFNVDGLYFFSDRIGAGLILGYQYLYRDFEDPDEFFQPIDQWDWNLEYGIKAGWYAPIKEVFKNTLGNSHLFVIGGISWLWSRQKLERFGKLDPENRFGYQVATGLLIPIGRQITLEGKLAWEARERRYILNILDNNGDIIRTIDETRWPSILSLGVGLKVLF